ncbi:MAG: hypothetical protein KDE27_21575 [Planctomycetes bacterium]|nr:hypothetical protein [Planctomycetota bacterium]
MRQPPYSYLRTALAAVCATALPLLAQQPTYHAAVESPNDPALSNVAGGAFLALPGLFTDLVVSGGGQFVELPNGSARLTGRVFAASSLYSAFLFDIELQGKVEPGQANYPPAGSPALGLLPSAYLPMGTVDPGTFVYYTQASGTLTGVRDFDGAVLDLQLSGPAVQVGVGANNRNGNLGATATFAVTVIQQPTLQLPPLTTAELSLDLPTHRTDDVTHPQVDSTRSNLTAGRAMVLPGVADDYVFVPAGDFTEYDDGHAELFGTLARLTALDDRWDIALQLTGRIDPGEVGCPPVGSPVLQMLPSAYVGNGGTMDPDHWHYYQTATGTLTGGGINDGGLIDLTNTVAVQYGGAANQTNTYFGYYGAFAATVSTQPTGRTIALSGADTEIFGLTAVFPVLPFPVLTPATPNYTLPTLTDQGVLVQGDNLAWAELVGIGFDLNGKGTETRWYAGYFRVVDNQTLEVHPRPGQAPGTYQLAVYNPAIRSNIVPLDLTAPTTGALYAETAVGTYDTVHLYIHHGAIAGPALSAVAISGSLLPTVLPGIVSLGIGNQQPELIVLGGSFLHDPATGIAHFDIGPVPPNFGNFTWHFQAMTVDLTTPTLPLPTTNVWSVTFQ